MHRAGQTQHILQKLESGKVLDAAQLTVLRSHSRLLQHNSLPTLVPVAGVYDGYDSPNALNAGRHQRIDLEDKAARRKARAPAATQVAELFASSEWRRQRSGLQEQIRELKAEIMSERARRRACQRPLRGSKSESSLHSLRSLRASDSEDLCLETRDAQGRLLYRTTLSKRAKPGGSQRQGLCAPTPTTAAKLPRVRPAVCGQVRNKAPIGVQLAMVQLPGYRPAVDE